MEENLGVVAGRMPGIGLVGGTGTVGTAGIVRTGTGGTGTVGTMATGGRTGNVGNLGVPVGSAGKMLTQVTLTDALAKSPH